MSTKYTYDGYTITVAFKSELNFSMTASFLATGELFMNQEMELSKIKKDTVLATLSKKNVNNLRCEFRVIDVEPRVLIVSFIVDFDYLPQFSEDFTLTQIAMSGSAFNKVSSVEIQSDIFALDRLLDSIKVNGSVLLREKGISITNKTEIDRIPVTQGCYIIQISGILTCPSQSIETFEIEIQNKDDKPRAMQSRINSMSSYGYPYSFTTSMEIHTPCDLIVTGWVKINAVSSTVANHITTLIPIVPSI